MARCDLSPSRTADYLHSVRDRTDRRAALRRLDEAACRFHLWPDRAGRKLVLAKFRGRGTAQGALIVAAPAKMNCIDVGQQQEQIDVEPTGQQGRREIPVDHGLDSTHRAVSVDDDREPSPASTDHQGACIYQGADASQLGNRSGIRRWHPGWGDEGRVARADHHLREDGDHIPVGKRISQRQLEYVADCSLTVVSDHDLVFGGDRGQCLRGILDVALATVFSRFSSSKKGLAAQGNQYSHLQQVPESRPCLHRAKATLWRAESHWVRAWETGPRGTDTVDEEQQISVVLADDHNVIRVGLRSMLEGESDLRVIGEAADAPSAAKLATDRRPDVLVLDLQMPGADPAHDIESLRESAPGTAIVVLTMQSDPRKARDLLRAGAAGYVLKQAAERKLTEAIRIAAGGGSYIDPELGGALAKLEADPLEDLSERERELLRLLALGHTNREIGERLFLSVRAIEVNRAKLLEKLGIESRPDLVRFAITHGVIETGGNADPVS